MSWRQYSRRHAIWNSFVLAGIFAIGVSGFYTPLSEFLGQISAISPTISIERSRWKIHFESGDECPSINCLANPAFPQLWNAIATVEDQDHFERARAFHNRIFWAGLHVPSSDLARIRSRFANTLIIGHINAAFEIFVNGESRSVGDGRDFLPITIDLTPNDLSGKDLKVAIRVNHNLGSARPLAIAAPFPTGFFNKETKVSFRNYWVFKTVFMNTVFMILFIFVSTVFINLWLSVRQKHEYFVFGAYTLCLGAGMFMWIGFIQTGMHREDRYLMDLALRISEGFLGCSVGLAYSRARISVYAFALAASISVFLGSIFAVEVGSDFLAASAAAAKAFVPIMLFLGAFACFTQYYRGKLTGFPMLESKAKLRVKRLGEFTILLSLLSILYLVNSYNILSLETLVYWHRPIQFSLVALIGAFIFRDFREVEFLIETTEFSRFHDPLSKTQKIVRGFLVTLDLKKSSRLYEYSASKGMLSKIPTVWCDGANFVIRKYGGVTLATAGDSISAYFPNIESAHLAIQQIEKDGRNLEIPGMPIEFRAAIVRGGILPIYREAFGKRKEDFEDAPGETSFKDLARILDTEKSQCISGSVLVLEAKFARDINAKPFKKIWLTVQDVGEKELCYYKIEQELSSNLRHKKRAA